MITVSTPSVIQCVASLGNVYSSMKQRNTAQAYYKKSLQLIVELYGKGAAVSHAADFLYNQANNYRHIERYCDAEQCYSLALNIYKEKSTGAGGPSIADTLNNMGLNYVLMNQYNKAKDKLSEALSVYEEISQGASSADIAGTLNNQGNNYYRSVSEYFAWHWEC